MSADTRTLAPVRPELVTDGFPAERKRWVEIVTSADHKDVGRVLIAASLGFLFIALVELLLMRLQLLVPENTFLTPVTFNRLLSAYGATAVFMFGIPLALGLFYFIAPLQIGARTTALPRLGQVGLWLFIAGATTFYAGFLWTPPEAGVNPLPPLSELAFMPNNGVDVWLDAVGLIVLGYLALAINLLVTIRRLRAPGMAWRRLPVFSWTAAICSWILVVVGPVLLAAITMLVIDRNFSGVFFDPGENGAPILWQHLSWLFFTGAYLIFFLSAAGAISEIIPALSRKPLFNRGAVIACLVAIASFGLLAWMQNMYTAPIRIGFLYFAMAMAMLAAVGFGLLIFNWIATMTGGALRMRAPLLFAAGAISVSSIGLAAELIHSMVAVAWQLKDTQDATAATHYALIGSGVFGGFAALHFWFGKITGRLMGESLARASFWLLLIGVHVAFLPLFLAGLQGQPTDVYKFFSETDVGAYNLIASIGTLVLAAGVFLTLVNAVVSMRGGRIAPPDPWGGTTLEWLTLSPPPIHNFDVVPDVRSAEPLREIREAVGAGEARARSEAAEPSQPVA